MRTYRAAGDPRAAARAAVLLSEVYVLQGNRQRLAMLTETLELLEPLPPGPEHVAVLTEISGENNLIGQYEAGLEVADRALALAEELGLGRPARMLGYRATNRSNLVDAGASDDFREALELALAAGQVRHASTISNNWSVHLARFEGLPQAVETLDAAIALCRARGVTARVNFMLPRSLAFHFELGELDEAREIAESMVERARREEDAALLGPSYSRLADAVVLQGDMDRLATLGDEIEAAIEAPCGPRAILLVRAAWIRAALGQRDRALAWLELPMDAPLVAIRTVRTAIDLGDMELAERLFPQMPDGDTRIVVSAAFAEARGDL
jgi:tetratricopeptide (TPR) repeat protein